MAKSNQERISFTVPSGNFGNVCAGHVARMMGLPIDHLVVATNENDVLDEFFRTGIYKVRTSSHTFETSSPSMDISKASNFERFIFDLTGRDTEKTAYLFGPELIAKGQFSLAHEPFFNQAAQHYGFQSGKSTHQNRLDTIRAAAAQQGQILDPHTADGIKVARDWAQPDTPMVVLETALPIKFESTILEALGRSPDMPPKFAHLESLPQRVEVMSTDVNQIKTFIETHCATP